MKLVIRRCRLLGFLTLLFTRAASQQLKGIIADEKGRPVEGVLVLLKKTTDSLFTATATSDKNGQFIFNQVAAGNYFAEIDHIGYLRYTSALVRIQQQPVQLPAIRLQNRINSLGEIQVEATGKRYLEQQADRTVVHVNAMISAAGSTAADVLNSAPGVTVNEDGTISLKGKEGALVYIDDKPAYLFGSSLLNYLRSLPASMLDKIELLYNPPARYNAEGNAGIILIRTKKQRTAGFNSNLSVSYGRGRYGRTVNSLLLNYKITRLNFFGSMGYSSINNYYQVKRDRHYHYPNAADDYMLSQFFFETNKTRTFSYKAGIDCDLDTLNSLGLLFQGYGSPYHERGNYQNLFISPGGVIDSSVQSTSALHNHSHNNSININFRHRFSTGSDISVNLDFLGFRDQWKQNLASSTLLPGGSHADPYTLISSNPSDAKIYSTRADYTGSILQAINLEAGAQAIFSLRNNHGDYFNQINDTLLPDESLTNVFTYRENINAVYMNLQKNIRRFTLQAGVRMETTAGKASLVASSTRPDSSFTIHYVNVFPTAYLSYRLDTGGQQLLTLSVGRRIGRPNYQDLNPSLFFFDRNTAITGNQLLQPGFATNADLLYSYHQRLIFGISYSRKSNDIAPAFMQLGDRFITSTANYDQVIVWGINATLATPVSRWLSINFYNELTHTQYASLLFAGAETIDNSQLTYRSTLYGQVKLRRGWSGDLTFNYRSRVVMGQAFLFPVTQLHAGVQKKINDHASVSITGRDLFHSWKLERDIRLKYARVYALNQSGTQQFAVTFSYRLGKQTNLRERKTGIQSEAGRL